MHMRFKRVLPFIIAAVFVFAAVPFTAGADPTTAHVSISVTPTEMSQAGTATVSITLKNTNSGSSSAGSVGINSQETDEPTPTDVPVTTEPPISTPVPPPASGDTYTGITISNSYGVAFDTSGVSVAAGSSRTFTGTMNVTTAMIGTSLSFTVSWYDGSTPMSETVTTMIVRANTPYLVVTRTATPAKAAPGATVTLRYSFLNSGAVRLVNITVTDKKITGSNSPIAAPFSLDPGQSNTVTYEMRMGSSTVESNPTVTYYAAGGTTQLSASVPSLTIGLLNSQLTKEVVRGAATPEGVPFTLYLTNNGNQTLKSLVVRDENGNTVYGNPFSLAVGESKTIQVFIPNPSTVRYVVFKITGTDANGTAFSDNTASIAVRPYIDVSQLGLKFTAHVVSPLDENNKITIEFSLENTGKLPYFTLALTEKELDYTLANWDSLASEVSDVKRIDLTLDGERELVFVLSASDSSGNPYTFEAYVNATYLNADELVPISTPDPKGGTQQGVNVMPDDSELGAKLDGLITSTGEKLMKWFRILGIIAIIAAVAMLVLGISEIVIRRNNRANNHRKA